MSFALTDEQELIQKTVRELATTSIGPRAREADLASRFPKENVPDLAAMGLLGIMLPGEEGGAGADTVAFALACEELAAQCGTTGAFVAVTNAWVTTPISRFGNQAMKDEWLPKLLSGKALGTYALHEDAVGGDPRNVRSTARPITDPERSAADGDPGSSPAPEDPSTESGPAILSGTKDLTFLVEQADLALVVARRGGGVSTSRRVDMYAIPTGRDGVKWGKDESKLGLRGYPTGPLYMTGVQVDGMDLVGEPGQGPDVTRACGQLMAIGTAACAVGLARSSLEAATQFANERVQFGQPIARYEAIQHAVADMRISIDQARSTVIAAAAMHDKEGHARVEAEEANVVAFETARLTARRAIRVHGGAGFMRDLPVERNSRDIRTLAALGRQGDVSKTLIGSYVLRLAGTA